MGVLYSVTRVIALGLLTSHPRWRQAAAVFSMSTIRDAYTANKMEKI